MTASARDRLIAFKRSLPRTPRLDRRTIAARGLSFAVFTSPEVASAPPLFCVNGGMLYSHAILWPALAPLAATRQLILYDQRGRGASGAPPAERGSRIEYDAGDVVAIREALGIERWDILGHSWGGGIAMLAAARDTAHVRRLVAVDAVGATSAWIPSLHPGALARLSGAERETLAELDPSMLHADDPEIHARYSRAIYPAYFADHDLSAQFSPPREASATGAAVAARLRREGYDWRGSLQEIVARTCFIHGADDVIPARLAHESAALIPGAQVSVIDAAGHMPFFERPDEFFAATGAFLAAPEGAGA
jgi:proline iminopeptidase